jgi:hypothetical protein
MTRGYSFHCGYSAPAWPEALLSRTKYNSEVDSHKRDLLTLQDLFISFQIDTQTRLPSRNDDLSFRKFQRLQDQVSAVSETLLDFASVRYIDFVVTKQWMRTVVWQSALSQGHLSSSSAVESLKYSYPGQIMRDLIKCLPDICKATFVAGGQDQVCLHDVTFFWEIVLTSYQLLKLFEIANSFADLVICSHNTYSSSNMIATCSPSLLLQLYEGMSPCLDKYPLYRNILLGKLRDIGIRANSPGTRYLVAALSVETSTSKQESLDDSCVGR